MQVEVRGGTASENEQLKKLTEDTFKDLSLGKKLEKILIISDIGIPVLYVACKFKRDVQPVLLSDISRIREQSGETRIQITHERYYDEVMELLGNKFGVENVVQDERNILYLKGVNHDIGPLTVYDFTEEIREHIIDALWHILPEGFKVRSFTHFEDGFIVTATDVPTIGEFERQVKAIAKEIGGAWHV
jgi:putative methanogenesis marker protein 17